ncbi:MAG: primosomal protein N' [Flavobacteriales bacterium]|nr:primosomal protein N' [Flavobacteriales bacterium]
MKLQGRINFVPFAVYVDVILPLAVPGLYTYAIPAGMEGVESGVRVAVPFGRGRKHYGAVVRRVHQERPPQEKVRPILSVLDSTPVVTEVQLQLWERIADHYLCTLGEVMLAALPGQMALSSETRLVAAPDAAEDHELKGRAAMLLDALVMRETITMEQAGELLGLKDPMPIVRGLMERGALLLEEDLKDTWKPKMVTYVRLKPEAANEEALHAWFDRLGGKAPKQLELLMRFVELSRCLSDQPRDVERSKLLHLSGATSATLKPLVEKGLFEVFEREADMPAEGLGKGMVPDLSEAQAKALSEIHSAFATHNTCLLRGVTSSGKTEVYMALIEEMQRQNQQVLYLLPEIALTTQMIGRLRARFGEGVAVFHSRMSQQERTGLWMRMVHDKGAPSLVLGARSALFLPFQRLGLIVVDEEHDGSYKQHTPAPRYHARDMALVLAGLCQAKVVLGSATPAMESLHNARRGRYGLVELLVRFGDVRMPNITRVDLRDSQRRKLMRGHFSRTMSEAITEALGRREQVIIFQNRRGYVPVWQCETCSWIPECDHCDVSLTYHKRDHRLRCHYCARTYPPPTSCGHCGGNRLRMLGLGTEKVEEELTELFPEARIARMDQDTTRGKQALERILSNFGDGALDILVGTQMVTKGLDFDRVSVVGILNADSMLRFPDFRAHERAFQLMAQVAGRSGRRNTPGTVIIQTADIQHPVLDLVVRNDVDGMYARELEQRRAHGYPPFMRLIELTLKHRYEERVANTAEALGRALREGLGEHVLGPEIPVVSRVRDRYLRKLLVKLQRSDHARQKAFVRDTIDRVFSIQEHAAIQLVTDVDPL